MKRKTIILALLLIVGGCSRGSRAGYPGRISGPAEAYLEGKGIEEAQAAVAGGLKNSPGSALLHYLDGDVKYLAGDFQSAATSFFDAVDDASRQPDPMGDILGVLSISTIEAISRYVPDFESKLSLAIEKTSADLYRNSDGAYFAMLVQKVKQLRRMGKFDEAVKAGEEGGCIQDWLKTGPFGNTELMGFDVTYPPEAELPWREVYTLREGEDPEVVRKADSQACWTSLGSDGISRGGAFYGLAQLNLPGKVDLALKIASFDPISLQIDGVEVARIDRRSGIFPNSLIVTVSLDPGIHHVVVKISSRSTSPLFMLLWKEAASPENGGPGASGIRSMPPDGAAVPVATPPAGGRVRQLPEPISDIDRLLLTDMGIALGTAVLARQMLGPLQKKYPHSFTVAGRTMLVEGLDSTVPFNLRMNRTKAESQDMRKRHGGVWMSYMFLSQLESQAGRLEDAVKIVKSGMAASPLYPGFGIQLADLYDQLGWPGESIEVLRETSAKLEGTCARFNVDYQLASKFSDPEGMEEAAKLIQSCDVTDRTYLDVLVGKEKWSEAHAVQLGLLRGSPNDRWLLMDAGWSSFKIGDIESYRKMLEKALDNDSTTLMEAMKLADLFAYEGKKEEAKNQLFEAVTRAGGPPSLIHQKIAAAQDFQYLFHYRRSFEEAVASFNAVKQASYQNTPSVEVLDHVTHRIYPDGSSLTRYHSIRKLMTKEGVEKNGEFAVPDNAALLKLHTIKPDGTILEPEKIYGKPTISYPMLEPGDFTETEWVQYLPPSTIYPGGTMLDRWYFQVPDMVLHRSEMILITPAGMEVNLNPRGALPEPKVMDENGLTISIWTVLQSPHIKFETNAPNLNEFLPSLQVTYKTSWDGYVEWIRDLLVDTFVVTPEMMDALKEITSSVPAGSDVEKARAIYRWVCDEIEDEEGLTAPVSFIFHQKRGDRTKLLYALLTAAGLPAELHLAETVYADKTATDVPDFNKYTHFLVYTGSDWLMPTVKKAYYGFLPYPVYDQDTLRIFPKTGKGHIPKDAFSGDEVKQTLKIEVDAEGMCTCDLTLSLHGANAAFMRDMLRNVPKGDIKNQIEGSFLAGNFPGADLTSLDLPDLEKPESTLTMTVRFTAPAQSGPMPGSLVIGPILKSQVAARWTQLPARSFPLLIDDLVNITTHAEIDGKGLWTIVAPPKPHAEVGMGPGISFVQNTVVDKNGSKLTLTRSLKIPIGRIPPSKYQQFLTFAGTADEAEGGVYLLKPAR